MSNLVTIYHADTEIDAQMIKNLLEINGILATLGDATIGTIAPHIAAGGGAGAIKVLIRNKDVEKARKIIKENN